MWKTRIKKMPWLAGDDILPQWQKRIPSKNFKLALGSLCYTIFFKVQFFPYLALANYPNSPKHYYMLFKESVNGLWKMKLLGSAGSRQAMVTVICLLWDFRQVSKSLWNLTFSSQYQNNNIFAFERNQWKIACQKNSHRTWHTVSSQNNLFNLHLSISLIRTYMIIKAWM